MQRITERQVSSSVNCGKLPTRGTKEKECLPRVVVLEVLWVAGIADVAGNSHFGPINRLSGHMHLTPS